MKAPPPLRYLHRPACTTVTEFPLTTMSAARLRPEFRPTAKPIPPGPVPDFARSETHDGAFSTAHVQSAFASTRIPKLPPSLETSIVEGLNDTAQGLGAGAGAGA